MTLTINNYNRVGGTPTPTPTPQPNLIRNSVTTQHCFVLGRLQSLSLSSSRAAVIVAATGKFTSRTGKFDSKNRRSSTTTTTKDVVDVQDNNNLDDVAAVIDDGYVLPKLPGDEPDFWEGSQWDALGFFVQYMWAFGIVFALVACGIAVATYNEGATDFRETPAYKESIQQQDLLEGPEASDTDVFESNPTEEAPALE